MAVWGWRWAALVSMFLAVLAGATTWIDHARLVNTREQLRNLDEGAADRYASQQAQIDQLVATLDAQAQLNDELVNGQKLVLGAVRRVFRRPPTRSLSGVMSP